ncbi:hypothetical protein Tco_1385880 [Tanacetum coccineum]
MSHTNNNLQTQTSNALYNAIMEAGGKDRPLMLAPCNYVQWKSIIKRYIDTKPNHELIHYCLENPPYVYHWIPNPAPETLVTDEEIRKKMDVEAEAAHINLMGIDNDIYSTNDACPNAMEMWKAIEWLKHGESINVQDLKTSLSGNLQHQNEVNKIRAKRLARTDNPLALIAQQQPVYQPQPNPINYTQSSSTRSQAATRNRGKEIANSPTPTYDPEPKVVDDDEASLKEKEIYKLMALISMSFKKIYKPTNNNLKISSNTRNMNVDNTSRSNRGTRYDRQTGQYDHQRTVNVAGARENIVKRPKDLAYHKEKMLLCKQEEDGIQLSAEQANWRDDNDDEPENQELEAHYMYMAKVQEVIPEDADNSGPIIDTDPLEKDNSNISPDSLNMCSEEGEGDQDDIDQECLLLASLIKKLKCEIDENKKRNKSLETLNRALQEANKEIEAVNTTLSKDIDKVKLEIVR